jgi:glycosyltransferase involved in cell wall biosynthesis
MPLVSVIMPCYNHAQFLEESISSILSQTHQDLELIIVDDASSDSSRDIVHSYATVDPRVKAVWHTDNKGVATARNCGIAESTGDYIAFCDADDAWEEDKLLTQLNCIQVDGNVDFVFTDAKIINEVSQPTGYYFSTLHPKAHERSNTFLELCVSNFINTSSVLFRRTCLNNATPFKTEFEYLEDWIYWMQLSVHYQFYYIEKPLVRYRIHSNNTNSDSMRHFTSRIECNKYILSTYSQITKRIKSDIYYKLGRDYAQLGYCHQAREAYKKALMVNMLNFRSGLYLLRSYLKP